jgi:hypothetical protein
MTDFLFQMPGFSLGVSRVVDLWGRFDDYNSSASPEEADASAIFSDWRATGEDIFSAMKTAEVEENALKSE